MNYVKMCVWLRSIGFLLLIAFSGQVSAQLGVQTRRPNVGINPNCNGYVEYLPFGYSDPGNTKRYPLLIFFKGNGSTGDGSFAALDNIFSVGSGFPPDQVRDGRWVDAFTVNGETHRFILISPQFVQPYELRYPTVEEVNSVLNYIIAQYRVDTSRIYLTGNSSGGGPVWDYVALDTTYTTGYPNRIAAIVPFCGVSWPTQARANVIKNANVAVWAFHNSQDDGVPPYLTQNYINYINQPPAPAREAKATIFPVPFPYHNCWYEAYNRMYSENGMNIYEWMLQFSKNTDFIFCPGGSTSITSNTTGSSYQWQLNTGSGFTNITNNSNYTGTNTVTLQLNNIPSNWSGNQYRCFVNGINSNLGTLSYRNQWTGAAGTSWENASNWTCNRVPDNNTDVVITSGAVVVVNSNAFCRSFTTNPGVNFTVNPGFTFTVTH